MTPNVCGSSPNAHQPLRIAAKTYETPYLAKILSGNIIAGRVLANAGSIAHLGIEPNYLKIFDTHFVFQCALMCLILTDLYFKFSMRSWVNSPEKSSLS